MSHKNLTDEKITEIIKSISKPVFNYTIKRFVKHMKEFDGVEINTAVTIFLASMSGTDANLLRWIRAFAMTHSKEGVDVEKLKNFFNHELNVQLEQKLH